MFAEMLENEQLRELYNSHYKLFSSKLLELNKRLESEGRLEERAANPYLLKVDESYFNADIKVMFFGQETNGWGKGFFSGEVQPIIDEYDFYLSDKCFSYGGQYWNGVSRLKCRFKEIITDKTIGYVANNVVKIGKNGKGFPTKINYLTNLHFKVIQKEISILKPDYIIFLSGPNYDSHIRNVISDFEYKLLDRYSDRPIRQLCEMIFESKSFKAFRTYHPNFLWRKSIDTFFNPIINCIKEDFESKNKV